jgi:hypothetical protein
VNLFRLYGDDGGDTHIARVELPPRRDGDGPRRLGFADIPTTTMTIGRLLEPKPDVGLHPAPRRQLVVVLRGALEVETTSGDVQQIGPGDGLLTDDLESKGHFTRQVGAEPLSTLAVGLAEDWELPRT